MQIYRADPGGLEQFENRNYTLTNGDLIPLFSTIAQTADFGEGPVNGRLLRMTIVWNPARYVGWQDAVFPPGTPETDRLPSADPNKDGVLNEIAYALDLDPLQTPRDQLPSVTIESNGTDRELVFTFRRNRIAQDVSMEVWLSDDLVLWDPSGVEPQVTDPDVDGDGSAELVEVRMPLELGEARKFAKLQTALE